MRFPLLALTGVLFCSGSALAGQPAAPKNLLGAWKASTELRDAFGTVVTSAVSKQKFTKLGTRGMQIRIKTDVGAGAIKFLDSGKATAAYQDYVYVAGYGTLTGNYRLTGSWRVRGSALSVAWEGQISTSKGTFSVSDVESYQRKGRTIRHETKQDNGFTGTEILTR